MTRISDWLIDPADNPERNTAKLLTIAEVLMRQVEQASGERGIAYEQFQRAAQLEERVRQRTSDLESTLRILNETNARLAEANRATERARRDLADAIEAVEEGFALFDASETLVMYNSRFCCDLQDVRAILHPGLSFADYIGACSRSRSLALPKDEGPAEWMATRIERHRTRSVFQVALAGDRWLQVSEQPTSDGGTVVLQTDVTEIIRMERTERGRMLDDQARLIHATLEHINQGICIFDAAGRLVGWNERLRLLLDIPVTVLRTGTGFDTLQRWIHRDGELVSSIAPSELFSWAVQQTQRPPLFLEIRRASGVMLVVFAEETPDRGFVMSFSDVTRERQAIQAMQRANASLEARVAARTEDLRTALADAERANSTRARFVAAASHDLLQPLSAAKLFVASARDEAENEHAGGTLDKAHKALASVEAILGALLDISRLDEAVVEISPVRLAPLFAQLTDEFAPVAERKGLRLAILPCAQTVFSDPSYLRRILQNLISNAIRYTRTGRVLVGPRRVPGGVRIEVHDTGPGIALEDQVAIFREFHRLNASASASEGLGLGLAIVERACALLNHRLTLKSTPGRGTCFGVELEQAPARAAASYPCGDASEDGTTADVGDRIALLVENDEELRHAISLVLERRGITVLEVASGEEALELVDEMGIVPDLYLVDQQLGDGLTGIETLTALKTRHGDRPARIITADRTPGVREACAKADVEIIYKPLDSEVLEAFVTRGG
ncbi:PAS-domain containing protein [Sinorhizobium sp. BJ1]|uniref:hybrid sensor histidine kinase/response regulator n=1 Tax=Sinorhizobium sp. BJ1 TaxID=2035455 RepID=UPI000BE9FD5C|nr:PAS-domain containing protein [Sinorhizobium sp. BJ1]PDT81273.1 hybrid sensor histidine kinase/response regulator [Sinorhizobium sp. BJ1]